MKNTLMILQSRIQKNGYSSIKRSLKKCDEKIICLLISGILAFLPIWGFAGNGQEHEEDLELIFLGRTLTKDSKDPQIHGNNDSAVLFGYLEDAIYLCIDQMSTQGQNRLDKLNNDFHVEGLPKSVSDISVPTADHEKYTHLGWDYKDYTLKDKWEKRQIILLATVSKVFNFPVNKEMNGVEAYSKQCVELSKIIYYVHILGDHEHNKFASTTDRIQLRNASRTRGEIEAGLINELRSCISELFWEQRTSMKYNWLRVKLNTVRFRAWSRGEEDSEKKHESIQKIAEDTIRYLQPQIRNMLMEQPFYRNVFKGLVDQD